MNNKDFRNMVEKVIGNKYDGCSCRPTDMTRIFLGYINHLWKPNHTDNTSPIKNGIRRLISGTYSSAPYLSYEIFLCIKKRKGAVKIWYVVEDASTNTYYDEETGEYLEYEQYGEYIQKEVTLSLDYFKKIVNIVIMLAEKGFTNLHMAKSIGELGENVESAYRPLGHCNGFYPLSSGYTKWVTEEIVVVLEDRSYPTEFTCKYDSHWQEIFCLENIGINKLLAAMQNYGQ